MHVTNNAQTGTHQDEDRFSVYELLMKRVLFACECCDGALVQIAMCRFCKTTTLRKCNSCGAGVTISHKNCIPRRYMSLHELAGPEVKYID